MITKERELLALFSTRKGDTRLLSSLRRYIERAPLREAA